MSNLTPLELVSLIILLALFCVVIAGVIIIVHNNIKVFFIKKRLKELEMEDEQQKITKTMTVHELKYRINTVMVDFELSNDCVIDRLYVNTESNEKENGKRFAFNRSFELTFER